MHRSRLNLQSSSSLQSLSLSLSLSLSSSFFFAVGNVSCYCILCRKLFVLSRKFINLIHNTYISPSPVMLAKVCVFSRFKRLSDTVLLPR